MNMKNWFDSICVNGSTKTMPILSFPSITLMDISVKELISDPEIQAKAMKLIADRCDTLASVSMMDLSVEAEAFGATIRFSDDEVPTVIGQLVGDMDAVEALKVPEIGDGRTGLYVNALEKATKLITDRPVFAGVIGPYSLTGRLMDLSQVMMLCYDEPETVHACLEKTTQFIIKYAKAFKAVGANGLVIAEPAAGLLSPALNEEFSVPYVKKIIEAVQDDTFGIVYHNCGNTIPLINSILSLGASAYHFGNAIDISQMMTLVPSNVIVMGNVEPAGQFRNGTPESIYAVTTEILKKCSHYKNFAISSGCDIPPLSPWANIDSFFKAISDYYKK